LRPGADHFDALRACFPGGSISGAPKKRALEIIRELEPFPRGLYTGCIGYLGANGESQFSIAIRTAVVEHETIHFHAGAGIVADSKPDREEEETWHKAATLLGAQSSCNAGRMSISTGS
jgi:para-aminobenzoate synthetase component 1